MLNENQQFGKKSEKIAEKYLIKHGYKILEKNYRTKLGEIDIIAKDNGVLVFIEVKARRSNLYGNPKYAITYKKQKSISKVALFYLKKTNQIHQKARFDVVIIKYLEGKPEIEVIKNAFDRAY